jgi:hypothetical protein
MDNLNTGGPAFPTVYAGERGMTLRDYTAIKAMSSFISIYELITPKENYTKKQTIAKLAYEMADEMLKARQE